MRAAAPLLAALLLVSAGTARADQIKLHNGNTLEGKIVREDTQSVSIRTRGGLLTFARKEILSLVRESAEATLLLQAEQAAQEGKLLRARVLLRRVIKGKDAEAARKAKHALAALEQAPRKEEGTKKPASGSGEETKDALLLPEKEALFRDLEKDAKTSAQARNELLGRLVRRARSALDDKRYHEASSDLIRASSHAKQLSNETTLTNVRNLEHTARLLLTRQALGRRKPRLALAAVGHSATSEDLPTRLVVPARYFHGRALEACNRRTEALKAYRLAIQRDLDGGQIDTYRELARLASVGVAIDEHSPGVGKDWKWLRTKHFAILHQLPQDAELGNRFERYRSTVIQRLGLERKLKHKERISVFLYKDEDGYRRSAGARHWTAGHATRLRSNHDDEEIVRVTYFYPSPSFADTARHEISHILMWDSHDEDVVFPTWASEGAALYVETDSTRRLRLLRARQLQHKPASEHLGRMRLPQTEDSKEIGAFYLRSGVSFAVLADNLGVDRALKIVLKINREGPKRALASAGWTLETFESRMRIFLENVK